MSEEKDAVLKITIATKSAPLIGQPEHWQDMPAVYISAADLDNFSKKCPPPLLFILKGWLARLLGINIFKE